MSDRLHDTLTSLRTDLDSTPLADPSAVRARGNQRTRRQAVGTTVAVVALVAGIIGGSAALTESNNADAPPPADRTTSEDPIVETKLEIGPEVLLGVQDLPPVPNQAFTIAETTSDATLPVGVENVYSSCDITPGGLAKVGLYRRFASDLDAVAWQWAVQYDTVEDARRAFTEIDAGCPRKKASKQPLSGGLPPGASGFRVSTFTADPGSEYFGEVAGVTRHDDVVTVLGLRAMVRKDDVNLDTFDAAVIEATERIAAR